MTTTQPVIRPKFAIGSTLWNIVAGDVTKPIPCPTCSEVGTIEVSGETFTCPKCRGRKMAERYTKRWYVSGSFDAKKIDVEVYENSDGWHDMHGPTIAIYYMSATSGTMHYEQQCFDSREVATAECERRNETEDYDMPRLRRAEPEEMGTP